MPRYIIDVQTFSCLEDMDCTATNSVVADLSGIELLLFTPCSANPAVPHARGTEAFLLMGKLGASLLAGHGNCNTPFWIGHTDCVACQKFGNTDRI